MIGSPVEDVPGMACQAWGFILLSGPHGKDNAQREADTAQKVIAQKGAAKTQTKGGTATTRPPAPAQYPHPVRPNLLPRA